MTIHTAGRLRAVAVGMAATMAIAGAPPAHGEEHEQQRDTRTPIRHAIIIVGENRTFDHLYGTDQPKRGQTIVNLRSRRIVNADGSAGPRLELALQHTGRDDDHDRAVTASTGVYGTLRRPHTTCAIGQPGGVPDTRFPADLPNAPLQISKYVSYGAYTGDPVHRFFQMWQQVGGGQHDKSVWVEQAIGTGSNGAAPPSGGFNTKGGAISMGFYNMNSYTDAPVFKALADRNAISDNYHQAVMGGTGANFQALVSGHAAFFTSTRLDGTAAVPFANQIENPDPLAGTNNYYTQDGHGGGSYLNCADRDAPGIGAVLRELRHQGIAWSRCAPAHYYLLTNYNRYWNQHSSAPRMLGTTSFTLPPQSLSTIADAMTAHGVSWKYDSADRGDDATSFATGVDGVPRLFHAYCGICDPLTGYLKIMQAPPEKAQLQNYSAFLSDVHHATLPSVSLVRPFEALAGHPADSTADLYELFIANRFHQVQSNPALWASTAIFITTDEGGGYYDSGYIQAPDFFGDGTRIPLIVVSPFARQRYVDHTDYDHVSLLKFVDRNWRLPMISGRSRDNLANPIADDDDPYRPVDGPAIGDLMNVFAFPESDARD